MSADNTTPVPDKSPDRINAGKAVEGEVPIRQPGTEFESLMQGTPGRPGASAGPTPGQVGSTAQLPGPSVTPLPNQAPTVNSLMAQAKTAQDSLGIVHDQLNTPNLKLKRSQAHLLRNKLGDANAYTRAAAGKLGIETPPMKPPTGGGAMERFMAFVNDGQDKMVQIQQRLGEVAAKGDEIRPGDMMLIQIKMGQAQQEIEYSSTLLGKVIDSIKQVLNIQL